MGQVLKREHGGRRGGVRGAAETGMLAALLALTGNCSPAPAYAADQLKGTGTADDPVLIYTTDDLIAWCDRLNAHGRGSRAPAARAPYGPPRRSWSRRHGARRAVTTTSSTR